MIAFLDFDGVLHPEDTNSKNQLFCRLPLVEEVLREFPRAEIVISSAWRLEWRYETVATLELRKHFSDDIAPRVVGVTPNYTHLDWKEAPDGLHLWKRQWEIEMWLRAHRPVGTNWIALDDRAYLFRPFCENLMEFERNTAFRPEHQDELRARLRQMQGEGK
ncbi:MAG: HAD domain-containing protein [Polaromonas sp.]|nr:HAD domain-containing protein [Polaromonas sp.]